MSRNRLPKTTNHVKKDGRKDSKGNKVRKEPTLGEVIWVKTNPSSWWLGQVVDENSVGVERKPKRKLVGEVLVRLYGTYSYLYADPEKYHDELMEILKQNNNSNREMFQKALDQEIAYTKSIALKRKISEKKEKARDGALEDKKLKPNRVNKNQKVDGLSSGNMEKLPKVRFRELRTRKAKGFRENLENVSGSKIQGKSEDLSSGRTRKRTSEVEILKQEEVKKGLEADIQDSEIADKISTSLKRKVSEHKESARDGGQNYKKSKQNGVNENQKVGGLSSGYIGKVPVGRTRILRPRKAKYFPKNLQGVGRAQTQVNRGHVSSGKTRKETCKTDNSKENGVKKGHNADKQGSAKGLPENLEGVSRAKTQVKGADFSAARTKKEISKNEMLKQDELKMGQRTDNHNSGTDILGKSPGSNLRRVRVMESLGLVAPWGSPFKRK